MSGFLGEGLGVTEIPVPGWFIILSAEQAAQVRGQSSPFAALDPILIADGRYILGLQILEDPDHTKHIPFLATLNQVRLLRDGDAVKVSPGSEKPGDPGVLARVYEPSDKQNILQKPPPPEKGDWSEAVLYESIGRALSRWEAFECEFANLFASLIGPSIDSTPIHRAYGAVVSFSGRLDMVRAAAEPFFARHSEKDTDRGKALKKAYDDISAKAQTLSGFRNRIAHGMVNGYTSPAGHDRGLALIPAHYAKKDRKLVPTPRGTTVPEYAYTSGEINFFGAQFWDLRIPTVCLWTELHQTLEIVDLPAPP
jgi:hypothetical protein